AGAAGAGARGRWRSGHRVGCPGRGAGPGRPRGLHTRIRRRGRRHAPPPRPAHRRPPHRRDWARQRGLAALPGPPAPGVPLPPRRASAPPPTRDTAGLAGPAGPLSGRERQVLELLATGKSNQQIADELVVVLATVKKHVTHILGKLAAANRTQAVARARALGLLR